ncbi:MAG TPA: GlsB/YeaQ/YmgE family stress response membrane protein [Thermoanaerobaculia bacterium]|nr:GlsB/YeaQ/YmgE family stress response membrane protein [Thermoanaerobaculia bacterium]
MSLLAWIVLGLLAGLIAKAALPGRDPGGCLVTILIGIVGALLGGWLSTLLGFGGLYGGLDLRNLVIATLGAIVLLLIWRLFHRRRRV